MNLSSDGFRKEMNISHILAFSGIACLYMITRYINISGLPIFSDEAVYIRWAQLIESDTTNLLLPLKNAKQPLFFWLNAITLKFFNDPLTAGRVVSIAAGFITAICIFLSGNALYNPASGLMASVLYVLSPYALFHDRMALSDSLLSMFSTAAILLSILISRIQPGQKGLFLYTGMGLVLGGGFLAKSSALSFLLLPPLIICILNPAGMKDRLQHLLLLTYPIVSLIIAVCNFWVKTPKELNPIFHYASLYLSTKELLSIPVHNWAINIRAVMNYLYEGLTFPVLMLAAFSTVYGIWSKDRKAIVLLIWALFPIGLVIFVGRLIFSRYILFCAPPLFIMTAGFIMLLVGRIRNGALVSGLVSITALFLILLVPGILADFYIVTDPVKAPMVEQDRIQYITGLASGYGIPEAVEYLEEKSRNGPIAVFTPFYWGGAADAFVIYLNGRPNIKVYEAWWSKQAPVIPPGVEFVELRRSKYLRGFSDEVVEFNSLKEAYFVTDSRQSTDDVLRINRNFAKVASFNKPGGLASVDIYKLNR